VRVWGLGEIWDQTEPAVFDVDIQSEKTYYPVEHELSTRIIKLAGKRGSSAEPLINLWLQEKVRQDIPVDNCL